MQRDPWSSLSIKGISMLAQNIYSGSFACVQKQGTLLKVSSCLGELQCASFRTPGWLLKIKSLQYQLLARKVD